MEDLFFWNDVVGVGNLYTEKELVVGVEPVLFVCTVDGNEKKRYLVMTYDSYEGIYVMIKIDNKQLLDMLENRVTMEETFRKGTEIIKTYIDDEGNMRTECFQPGDFDGDLLPRKNEYFELKSRHIISYIEKLKKISYQISTLCVVSFEENQMECCQIVSEDSGTWNFLDEYVYPPEVSNENRAKKVSSQMAVAA